jgi:large subunit ribosomal protein L5e
VVYARLQCDFVLSATRSKELPRYHGLTNWAAGELLPRHLVRILTVDFPAYTTGLICTRRALTKLGLGDKHEGVTASDGIFVPRSDKRFPEYDAESKELNARVLKKYIYGGHVTGKTYSNKEIFLRELISNGSDALDKIRYATPPTNLIALSAEK